MECDACPVRFLRRRDGDLLTNGQCLQVDEGGDRKRQRSRCDQRETQTANERSVSLQRFPRCVPSNDTPFAQKRLGSLPRSTVESPI